MRLSYSVPLAVLSGLAALAPSPALAQIQLPGIYVQGATLEAPKRPPSGPPAGSAGQQQAQVADGGGDTVAGVPAETIGNALSIVTGEELRRQQVRHAGEALRSLPGVSVGRTGGVGNLTQVRIRGAEGNHTLVLIDGIEANNTADGEFDFSNLSAEEIERIEVIRGPMSGLYGSNAVGGVVNIITRQGRGPMTVTFRTEAGSLGTRDAAVRIAGGTEKGHLAVSYHWRDTDGFNISPLGGERDGSMLGSLAIKGGVKLLEGVTLDFTVRRTDKRADRDGFADFLNPALAGTLGTAFDDGSTLRNRVLLAGTNLRWDTLNGALTHEIFANRNGTITEDVDRGDFPAITKNVSETNRIGYLATYRLDMPVIWAKHAFSGRVERELESFTPGPFTGDPFGPDGIERDRSRLAVQGEWRGAFADRLFITVGVRHDDNNNFQDFTTWRGAASLVLREWDLRPHASVGTAVKLPTMFEQFGRNQFFVPNADLAPEESFGWDAGMEFTFLKGKAILDITYFQANLENKINGFVPVGGGKFTAQNLPGESTREGVEVAARFVLTPGLTLGAAYTYLDARNPNGEEEVRRSPHGARADLAYSFAGGRGSATLAGIYNGRMEDLAFVLPDFTPQRVNLGEYWLVNATISYKLQPGVEIFGRVENMLDQNYQEAFGFESAPIAAFAGVKLTFGGLEGVGGSWAK
jgi:vitamin B12 transporter